MPTALKRLSRPPTTPAEVQRLVARAPKPSTKKKQLQHRAIGLLTILVVPGFMAASSIPAFAVGTPASEEDSWTTMSAPAANLQSAVTAADTETVVAARDAFTATTHEEIEAAKAAARRTAAAAARAGASRAVSSRAAGDDYPFRGQYGLSSLRYVASQCTDFVAWRLNRDAGFAGEPWKYTWANMTPGGGSASQWASAWASHGWATSHTPVTGAVAWFYGNHVAYVKSVGADGSVDLEEYNWNGSTSYHTRTIPAASVGLFLYPPP